VGAARDAGFDGVELLFPYDLDPAAIRREAEAHGMPVVQINSPTGNRAAGEMGFAALPGAEARFEESIRTALDFLRQVGSSQLHVLAGSPPHGTPLGAVHDTYVRNLQWAADAAAAEGVRINIEPLNSRDAPGYALSSLSQAAAVINEVGRPNLGLQFDLYHSQIMGGDLTYRIRKFAPLIRHVQIAGSPDRNEPDRGEVSLAHVLGTLAQVGYEGWISGEYRPGGHTLPSLQWMQLAAPYRQAPASSAPEASS
jgi:hydroxypyruvate isomerase